MLGEEAAAAALLVAAGPYLVAGLAVAFVRQARRDPRFREDGRGELAQFFVELLLWPAALVISRSG